MGYEPVGCETHMLHGLGCCPHFRVCHEALETVVEREPKGRCYRELENFYKMKI
jgi:hypothetical protein